MSENSKITWPKNSNANYTQTFESLDLLYSETKPEISGTHLSLAISSCDIQTSRIASKPCILKLDVTASPFFKQAQLNLSHEVLPEQGCCSQIISVNPQLRVAGFDKGCVIPIKNFGPKKTFNCDVRARLSHHIEPINVLAADTTGKRLASGSTSGQIVLYDVEGEEISFLSRTRVGQFVTGLSYVNADVSGLSTGQTIISGDNALVYSTVDGLVGLMDPRCNLGADIRYGVVHETRPRLNLSSSCCMNNLPGLVITAGSAVGHIFGLDLRSPGKYLYEQNLEEDHCIRRMRQVLVKTSDGQVKTFLAYTNSSQQLQILDIETMGRGEGWICDRLPEGIQKDFIQVEDRLVSCGEGSSIGCWAWDHPAITMES